MKKAVFTAAAVCMVLTLTAPAAVTIDYSHVLAGDGTLTTANSGAIVDTFDDPGRPGWTYTGNGAIVSGSASGLYAAPYNSTYMVAPDATNFFTVPEDASVLSATVDFGGPAYNYLGLFWGSVDSYNQIEFLSGGAVVAEGSWTGTQAVSPSDANGNQSAPSTNLYVNFYDVPDFDAVRFTSFSGAGGSSPFAFEFDNLAVKSSDVSAQVPAPGAFALVLLGAGLSSAKLRRRRR